MPGKSIRLFLIDGSPQGMRTAEVGNWTGLALVCPRTDLARLGGGVVDDPSFARLRVPPVACERCPHLATCGGGCPTRRTLRGAADAPDAYCPIVLGRPIALTARHADAGRALTKAASACTTVLRARQR